MDGDVLILDRGIISGAIDQEDIVKRNGILGCRTWKGQGYEVYSSSVEICTPWTQIWQ